MFFRVVCFFAAIHLALASSSSVSASLDLEIQLDYDSDQCTSVIVGKKATVDGSTITTHNADCQDCDIRITHVPARDWPAGSKRPVYDIRMAYPRYVETPEMNIHGPDYLTDRVDRSIFDWPISEPIGFIDQVPHTFSYTLGAYGIQNEKQVSIGESTCPAVFYAKPPRGGGHALMHMETLTEIAMERCETARCAIQLMGDLAVQYGFYGPGWDVSERLGLDEAGEALSISDPHETWMFHILPDDSATSAVWVAQRVPDDHISVVANQFVIGQVHLNDPEQFMYSSNMIDVAIRAKRWSPDYDAAIFGSGKPFNFLYSFAPEKLKTSFACTRRVWRVLTMAAPSLLPFFSPFTDAKATFGYGENGLEPYPFSVKPDQLLNLTDILRMKRDNYENTQFDMTKGIDAGPYGDPIRWPEMTLKRDVENGMNRETYLSGLMFQRAISLWRTVYSTVTQSRASLPDEVGAVTWVAQYAPHHSSYVPVYASADQTPSSLNTGTPYKMDRKANWWIHCLAGNYLSRWFKYTITEVVIFQKRLEEEMFRRQQNIEEQVVNLLKDGSLSSALDTLRDHQERTAIYVRDAWWDWFFEMAGTFRDLYKVTQPHAETFGSAYLYLAVDRWWFEQVGYFGPPGTPTPGHNFSTPIKPINFAPQSSPEAYKEKYPTGFQFSYPTTPSGGQGWISVMKWNEDQVDEDEITPDEEHSSTPTTTIITTTPTTTTTTTTTQPITLTHNEDSTAVLRLTRGTVFMMVAGSMAFGISIGAAIVMVLKRKNSYSYLPVN